MIIRPAIPTDYEFILDIFMEIVVAGETFVLPRDLSREQALAFWCGRESSVPFLTQLASKPASKSAEPWKENKVFISQDAGKIVGSYYLKPNHLGPGSHVANAGYIVAPDERGKHIGRSLAEHSIAEARRLGFRALQFNFVVATNEAAVRLWTRLGFRVIGTLPGVFQHPAQGYVDAYVMFLELISNGQHICAPT